MKTLECLPKTNEGWRFYQDMDTGNKYLSVTTILDCIVPYYLTKWFKKTSAAQIKKKSQTALDHGSSIHKITENADRGIKQDLTDDQKKHLDRYNQVKKEHKIIPIESEVVVYSDAYGYAGRLDLLAEVDGEMSVCDKKTGRSYDIKTGWQIAAYKYAYEEMHGISGLGMTGIHLPSDDKEPKVFKYEHFDWCWNCFLAAHQAFRGLYFTRLKKENWKWLHIGE